MGCSPIITGLAVAICIAGQVPVGMRNGTSLPQSGWDPHHFSCHLLPVPLHLHTRAPSLAMPSGTLPQLCQLRLQGQTWEREEGVGQGAKGRREAKAGKDRDWTNRAGI